MKHIFRKIKVEIRSIYVVVVNSKTSITVIENDEYKHLFGDDQKSFFDTRFETKSVKKRERYMP